MLGSRVAPDPLAEPSPNPMRVIWSTAKETGPDAAPVILNGVPDTPITISEDQRSGLVDLTATRGLVTEDGDPSSRDPSPWTG